MGNITGYASHSHINDCLFQSNIDLRCIILTITKQIIAFKKGPFAPPAPPTERQEGACSPCRPLFSVPGGTCSGYMIQHFHWKAAVEGTGMDARNINRSFALATSKLLCKVPILLQI